MSATRHQPRVHALWLAARDRLSHARVGRETRTLCGRPPIDERYAWPANGRCGTCVDRLAEREAAAHA